MEPEQRRSVVVLGTGRSGTSMVAGTLAAAGWHAGADAWPANGSNPKGFFETPLVNGINEWLLAQLLPPEADFAPWQRWLAVPAPEAALPDPTPLAAHFARATAAQPFVLKDPRLSFTLPAWEPWLGDAARVCVFRHPAVTAASIVRECERREYLGDRRLDAEAALALWTATHRNVLERLRGHGDWLFLHYAQLLEGDGIARLEDFVGAPVARDFPDAELDRTRAEHTLPPETAELYRELCALAGRAPEESATTPVSAAPHERLAVRDDAPALSVLICSYQRAATLTRCLAAFEAQDAPPGSFELVVVNDGSSDETRALLDARDWRVPARVLHRANGGLAAARNTGLAAARGRLLLLVNDDTLPEPDCVRRHLETHARLAGERACVLGSFEQPPEALRGALMRCLEQSSLVFAYAALEPGGVYDWSRFWTCNVSAPAAAVRAAGGFDEAFRHYGCEDTDLGIRLAQRGFRVHYEPRARAFHEHVLDLDGLEQRARTVARAWVRLFAKHPEALGHPDWRWVAALDRRACERFVEDRLPELAGWRAAAAELAETDLGALERAERAGSALSRAVVRGLDRLLAELNAVWWREGLAEGLAELDLPGFSALAAASDARPARRIFAWPAWTAKGLEALLADYGPTLADRGGVTLVLRHAEPGDGPLDTGLAALEAAYARHLPSGARLDVELERGPLDRERRAALAASLDAVLALPDDDPERTALRGALGGPSIARPEDLAALLSPPA